MSAREGGRDAGEGAVRRRLADVLSCDDAVRLLGHVDYLRGELTKIQKRQMQAWEDEADVFNEMTRKGLA